MKRIESPALLVRSVEYGESDLIITLITETHGKIGALVRGGRKSSRRFGGALEPFHSMSIVADDRGGDLTALREAQLTKVRARLVGSLDAVDAGGTCLRWARHLFPVRTPEPEGWRVIVALLDALDEGARPLPELAAAGVALLTAVGYALDLERCVRCAKPCPEGRPAAVDAVRGGLVCQTCGGGPRMLSAETRRVAQAFARGERAAVSAVSDDVATALLALAEDTMTAHADLGA